MSESTSETTRPSKSKPITDYKKEEPRDRWQAGDVFEILTGTRPRNFDTAEDLYKNQLVIYGNESDKVPKGKDYDRTRRAIALKGTRLTMAFQILLEYEEQQQEKEREEERERRRRRKAITESSKTTTETPTSNESETQKLRRRKIAKSVIGGGLTTAALAAILYHLIHQKSHTKRRTRHKKGKSRYR